MEKYCLGKGDYSILNVANTADTQLLTSRFAEFYEVLVFAITSFDWMHNDYLQYCAFLDKLSFFLIVDYFFVFSHFR